MRRQLARTLLILGSVSACERAHPDCEPQRVQLTQPAQPAPEAPKPGALAMPLANTEGSPAVGNIGQIGAPRTVERPKRRVQRVQRAATLPRPAPIDVVIGAAAEPRTSSPQLPPVPRPTTLQIQAELPTTIANPSNVSNPSNRSFQEREVAQPLLDRRGRAAVMNKGRAARMEPEEDGERAAMREAGLEPQ